MNWEKMTPEERNRCVAEKVMGWQAKECDGGIGEQPCSPDGWYCEKCGYEGSWGDDMTHEQIPLRYSESIAKAWEIVEKMLARQEEEHYFKHFEWKGPQFKPSFHYLTNEGYPLGTTCWYVYLCVDDYCQFVCAQTPQDAICLAALRAVGVEV